MPHTGSGYPNGLSGQLMYKKESVYGTRVVTDLSLPLLSCSLAPQQEVIEPAGVKAGGYRMKRTDFRVPWAKGGAGTIELEVSAANFGAIFGWALGLDTISAPGATAKLHTCTFADLPSFTVQVGIPTIQGVVEAFTFDGCMVTGWDLSGAAGEMPKLSLDVDARVADHLTDLTVVSYNANDYAFHWGQCSVKVGGAQLVSTKSFSLKVTNPLNVDRNTLDGTGKKLKPLESGLRSAELTLEVEWNDITKTWDDCVADTTRAIVIDYLGTTAIEAAIYWELKTTLADCRLKGEAPTLSGADTVTQTLTYDVLDAAVPVKVELTNKDAV